MKFCPRNGNSVVRMKTLKGSAHIFTSFEHGNASSMERTIIMKKLLCTILVFVCIFTIIAPISASATTGSAELEPCACTHSKYTTSYYYTYIHMDSTYHEVYCSERRICDSCNSVFYVGSPVSTALEKHTGSSMRWVRSVHEGLPPEHYYVYGGTCTVCHGYCEKTQQANCTKAACVEVFSHIDHETY